MVQGVDSLEFRADEAASAVFNDLVTEASSGRHFDVEIDYIFTEEIYDDGDSAVMPTVTIDGIGAQEFAKLLFELDPIDEELVDPACVYFEEHMAALWSAALEHAKELKILDAELDVLAATKFKLPAEKLFFGQGYEAVGEIVLHDAARSLARTALDEWTRAVDIQVAA